MLLLVLLQIALVSGSALRRVLEAPPIGESIVSHHLEEIPNDIQTSDSTSTEKYPRDSIPKESPPGPEFDLETLELGNFRRADLGSDDVDGDDENQLSIREAGSAVPPYPVDEPGKSLKQRPDQLISPAKGLPRNYFNTSNYRPWRPSHDKARPKDRVDWRQPRKSAYCILGGIGKRQVFWQPPLVQDFFNLHHQHDHPETNDRFPVKTKYNKGHDFQYFFNTATDTNITKAYSIFITAERARIKFGLKTENYMEPGLYHEAKAQHRLESCRRDCATCWDAAQETGAEQFICSREEGNSNSADRQIGDGGWCRMAMVLGDPIGKNRICQIVRHRDRLCPQDHKTHEEYAQPGAVHNPWVALVCDSMRPCIPGACQVDNNTRLLAQGASCRMIATGSGGATKGATMPRWGSLGYESLYDAMNDSSLQVYYQDFTPDPTAVEKAWILDSPQHFGPDKAKKYYGPWWSDYTAGMPKPRRVTYEGPFPPKSHSYGGPVGFGSVPGGFDLKTDKWARDLIYNLSHDNMDSRERFGPANDGGGRIREPGEDDYMYRTRPRLPACMLCLNQTV